MFKLNGDIIRQLETLFLVSFYSKYKVDIKDKILLFLNNKLSELMTNNFFSTLSNVNHIILIENNKIVGVSEVFLEENKSELFSYFNPIWFNETKKVSIKYLKKDMYYIFNTLCCEFYFDLNKHWFVPSKFFNQKKIFERKGFEIKNIHYSNHLYKMIIKHIDFKFIFFFNNPFLFNNNRLRDQRGAVFFKYIESFLDNLTSFDNKEKKAFLRYIKSYILIFTDFDEKSNLDREANLVIDAVIEFYYLNKLKNSILEKLSS